MTDKVDPETSRVLDRMWDDLSGEDREFGDWWSACFRPGSWEYNRPYAELLRRKLAERGYAEGLRWAYRNNR